MATIGSKNGTLAGSAVDYTINTTEGWNARDIVFQNKHASNDYTVKLSTDAGSGATFKLHAGEAVRFNNVNLSDVSLNGTGGYQVLAADSPGIFRDFNMPPLANVSMTEITEAASGQVTVLDLYEDQDNGSNKVSLQAAASLTANRTLTMQTSGNLDLEDVMDLAPSAASASAAASLTFKEDTDNGTNACTLIGPTSTANVTATLPDYTSSLHGGIHASQKASGADTVQTTDGTATTISTIAVGAGKAMTVSALVTGSNATTAGETVHYAVTAGFHNASGTVSAVGTAQVGAVEHANSTGCNVTVTASGANALLQVTGEAATTYDWQCLWYVNEYSA